MKHSLEPLWIVCDIDDELFTDIIIIIGGLEIGTETNPALVIEPLLNMFTSFPVLFSLSLATKSTTENCCVFFFSELLAAAAAHLFIDISDSIIF